MAITKTIQKQRGYWPITDVRVVDGDTLEATIHLEFDTPIKRRIRLKGWWADEPKGLYAESGMEAKARLHTFVQGKALWLFSPSGRLDRYGRVVGHIIHHEQIVNPKDVLGHLQLTEHDHQQHRAQGVVSGQRTPDQNAS